MDKKPPKRLLFAVDDNPPWPMTIFLGLQHYLLMFVSSAPTPLIFASAMCLPIDGADICGVINTVLFISGITTIIQATFGTRLPIVQGPSYAYLVPMLSMLSQITTECPQAATALSDLPTQNATGANDSHNSEIAAANLSLAVSHEWKFRMREVQGAVLVASVVQVLTGTTGLVLLIVRFIGPLTIAPTIALIGLALFDVAGDKCSTQWGIAILTIVLITVFSQYLSKFHVKASLPSYCGGSSQARSMEAIHFPVFGMFSLLFGMVTSWLICFVLTISGALGETPEEMGYLARTDINLGPMRNMAWFRVPYPVQWGLPRFTVSGILGMITAMFVSMIESIGDYYACARVAGAPVPPPHAMNRGIAAEGIGGLLAGLFGTGVGSTSFSQNIAIVGITRVGSRRTVQVAAVFMIVLALFGKLSAIFVTIPQPIIGGLFLVVFGMVTSVGLSNLQYVDLSSSRNLFILGLALLTGLTVPFWTRQNADMIKTGIDLLDSIVYILLTTGMFLAGLVGCVLDNTIPGTLEERGIVDMNTPDTDETHTPLASVRCYNIPFVSSCVRRNQSWTSRLPICHNFRGLSGKHSTSASLDEKEMVK